MTIATGQASDIAAETEPTPQRCDPDGPPARRVFGIKAELFLAFCGMAAMTAGASAVAWYAFTDIDRAVTRIIDDSIPDMVSSLRLAEKSAEIAATAPALVASADQEERLREQAALERRGAELMTLVDDLSFSPAARKTTADLTVIAEQITAALEELSAAVDRRLRSKARREAAFTSLAEVHTEFLDTLEPLIDDALFDLVITGEEVTADGSKAITGLVEGGVVALHQLLTINADGNLVAGLLARAAQVENPALIGPIRERFVAAAAAIERSFRQLPGIAREHHLVQAAAALLELGTGADNVFERGERRLRASGITVSSETANERDTTAIEAAHEAFLLALTPMIDDAVFDLVISSEEMTAQSTAALSDLIDVGALRLRLLLVIRAEGNLAVGLLGEAAGIHYPSLLQPLHERFTALAGRIERSLAELPQTADLVHVRRVSGALSNFGMGTDDLFELRAEELRQDRAAEDALATSRALAVRLGDQVAELVAAAQMASGDAALRSAQSIADGKRILVVIAGISVAGAVLIVLLYVVPRVVRPLERITAAMTDLAAGDISVDVPGRDRRDEIGRMAQALGVFRDITIEVQESNRREIRDTRRRLREAIESITEGFSLYDHEDRLVVANDRYRSVLYPGIADEISPGMTFESIIRRAAERGHVADAEGRVDEWVAERLERHRRPGEPHVQRRTDGRWILISERNTADGGTVAVYSDITELKQREEELAEKTRALETLSSQLAKYLSPQVYESIFAGRQEVKIASKRKKLTVFFSDIAGFTETVDRMESEDLTNLLNHYLTEMSQIGSTFGATIDKYIGDAIVIFFGDPESRGIKEDALACVQMAIAMRKRLSDLQMMWRDAGIETPLRCRMGISTGYCTVGNFGSEDRMDYTIIGGGVNLASRLESAAAPGEILISYETWAHVRDEIHCEKRGSVTLKGISHPVATYQVVDRYDTLDGKHNVVREDLPSLRIQLDLDTISTVERHQVMAALRNTLDQLSAFEQGAAEKDRRNTSGQEVDP